MSFKVCDMYVRHHGIALQIAQSNGTNSQPAMQFDSAD